MFVGAMKFSQASWSSAHYGALPKPCAGSWSGSSCAAGEQEDAKHSTSQENNAQGDPLGGSKEVIDKALIRICSPKQAAQRAEQQEIKSPTCKATDSRLLLDLALCPPRFSEPHDAAAPFRALGPAQLLPSSGEKQCHLGLRARTPVSHGS